MKLRQKMMTNATFIVVFYFSYETRVEDNNECTLSLSSIFFLALQKTMMNLPTHRCLLQLKKKTKKTQNPRKGREPSNSSSSFATKEKKP
jgi:hypothetical protein